MKILFVHEVNYLEKVVFEMHEYPEHLALAGHEVIFIDYAEGARQSRRIHPTDRVIAGRSDERATLRLVTVPQVLPGTLDRLRVAFLMIFQARSLLRKLSPDVVVSYAVPTMGWQFNIASRRLGIPFLYRAIDVSHKIRGSFFSLMVRAAERFMLRRSDFTLFNNQALLDYGTSHGCPVDRSAVVHPGFDPWPGTAVLPRRGVDFEYNTVFLGTLFPFSGVDWFVEELATNPRASDIRLLVVGDGELREKLVSLVGRWELTDRVHIYGRAEYDELPALLQRAKIAVIPFDLSDVTRFALPGKVPQYIRSALPTVATPLDGLVSFMPPGNGVVYAQRGQEFIDECVNLLDDEKRRRVLVEKGNERLDADANWDTQTKELESLMLAAVEALAAKSRRIS